MPRRFAVLPALAAAFCLLAAPSAFAAPSADLTISNTGSPDPVAAGQYVSEEISVTNNGPDPAVGVTVTDPLPAGTQFVSATFGCTYAANLVTCPLGTLPPTGNVVLEVVLRLTNFSFGGVISNTASVSSSTSDPNSSNNSSTDQIHVFNDSHDHHITPYKVEEQWDFNPGTSQTHTLSCQNPNDFMTDASMRVDNVDQGTGNLRSITLTEEQSVNGGNGYEFTATNYASGRAQTKLFGMCLPKQTAPDTQQHDINHESLQTATFPIPGSGASTAVVHCNSPNFVAAAAPGYELTGGAQAEVVTSEPDDTAGPGWRFKFISSSPGSVTVSIVCLNRYVGTTAGHTHELWLSHPDTVITVPPNWPSGGEYVIDCSDEAKGIVASFDLPFGVWMIGHDPQPKRREFKLVNETNSPQDVHIDLLCIGDRTGTDPPPPAAPKSVAASARPAKSGANVPVSMTCPAGGCSGSVSLLAGGSGSRAVTAAAKVLGTTVFRSNNAGRIVARVKVAQRYRTAIRNHKLRNVTVVVYRLDGSVAKRRPLRLTH